jgi:IS5 family transposase
MYLVDNQLKIEDFIFPYGELDINNRWVKLAAIIPWNEFEETYAKQFINNGRQAKPLRIALGSLIIKQKLNCSDRETVSAIVENPYLQYFIGLKEFQNSAPFGASSMVEFRKRISDDMIIEMNNTILKDTTTKKIMMTKINMTMMITIIQIKLTKALSLLMQHVLQQI